MNAPIPARAAWLSEPSMASAEIIAQAGYEAVVLDIEHGAFDLSALHWFIPALKRLGLRVIAKVLAPERSPIQQALDFGANAICIPHVESAEHAEQVCAFAKFPPRGARSFAGGHTSNYGGFTDEWVAEQDAQTACYPMIEDATAVTEIEEILALDTVDGVFLGPSDLSLTSGRGAYSVGEDDLADLTKVARAARAAGKHWIIPAWSEAEQRLAIAEGAHTAVLTMQYAALLAGFQAANDRFGELGEER